MILLEYCDFKAYGVVLKRQDGAEYYAVGTGRNPALFSSRREAYTFRDQLAPHVGYKGRVVKVHVRIEPED